MDINEQKKFVFKKEYKSSYGTIPEGMTVILFHGHVYCNGGLCDSASANLLLDIVTNKQKREEYLTQLKIIENKI